MNKHVFAAVALAGLSLFPAAEAYSPSISLDCSGQNHCTVAISGITYDTITWFIDQGSTDAIFPINCTNLDYCPFYCSSQPGMVSASVYLWNGQQLVGYASSQGLCSQQ